MTGGRYEETALAPYRCRLEWGRDGTRRAVARGDVVIIVDTLRFSTAVTVAVAHGALVYPCIDRKEVEALARRGAEADEPMLVLADRNALSPLFYQNIRPGSRVLLASPNGATCSRLSADAPLLLIGALVNAQAVADAALNVLADGKLGVTVVACGERRTTPGEDGPLRLAIEDYLGAGAIFSYLQLSKSAEASVCQAAFEGTRERIAELIWESISGLELRQKGLGADVEHAAQLDRLSAVARMAGDWLVAISQP